VQHYAGFQTSAQLDAPASSFGFRPRTYKIALSYAPLSDLSNGHGSNPWLLVQRDKSSAHERAVGRPGGGLIAEPLHPFGHRPLWLSG
jgi:hypothetical protein